MSQSKIQLFFCVLTVCISIFLTFPLYNVLFFNFDLFGGKENCPLCYGTNMCNCLKYNFSLNWDHFWTNIVNLMRHRVIFGFCDGTPVVIKKFSTPAFYINVSESGNINSLSEVGKLIRHSQDAQSRKRFELCPSWDNLERLYIEFNESCFKLNESLNYTNFLHIIQVDVEPIVQQIGWAHGWAVAEYLGSCGDAAFSRDCGESLTLVFPRLDWAKRASLARQLLQFALNATLSHPEFAFYFTDMTSDNFAVSSDNIVRLVDLEDVIIVDKYPKDPPELWLESHQCDHDDTEKGFVFSPRDVCSHQTSDLNVYSICQGILSEDAELLVGGLLHTPPLGNARVAALVQDCVSPPPGLSRFTTALSLLNELTTVGT